MSEDENLGNVCQEGVPRARGDEPRCGKLILTGFTCSPRERG